MPDHPPYRSPSVLDADQKRVHDELVAIVADPSRCWESYCALPESHSGKVINIDIFRDLHPEYHGSGDDRRRRRTHLTPATYAPAKQASREWYAQRVAELEPGSILFTGGGPASGKTRSMLDNFGDYLASVDLVMDTSLTDIEEAQRQIALATEHGHVVVVAWIYRPFAKAVQSMIERACSDGRYITLERMATLHRGSKEAFLSLAKSSRSSDHFSIRCLLNAYEDGLTGRCELDDVIPLVTLDMQRTDRHAAELAFNDYCKDHAVPEDLSERLFD